VQVTNSSTRPRRGGSRFRAWRDRALGHAGTGLRGTLLALIVLVPLFVAPGITLDPYNIPKFGLFVAGMSLVAGLWVFVAVSDRPPRIIARDLIVPVSIVAPLALSWFFSHYREWALLGQYSRLQGLVPYLLFALFSLIVAAAFRGRAEGVAWALCTAGGLVGAAQMLSVMGFSPTGGQSDASTIGNSNFVGGFLAITLPIALHLWLHAERNRARFLAIALTILICDGLVLSFSEGGQAAGVAGALVVIGWQFRKRPRLRLMGALAALGIGMGLIALVAVPQLRSVGGFTATLRSHWWGSAVALASEAPVIGKGPNAFALEGSRYRSRQDVIAHRHYVPGFTPVPIDYQTSDDVHSVPLSVLVASGGVGLGALSLAWLWILRRGVDRRAPAGLYAAFFGALLAYLVQSGVSVDEVPIRLAFFASLGGFLAALPRSETADAGSQVPRHADKAMWRSVVGLAIGVAMIIGGTWWAFNFVRADRLVREGVTAFSEGDHVKGEARIRSALAFRDEVTYKQMLSELLGLAGLQQEERGAALIAKMERLNAFLKEIPDVGAIQAYARLLNYWGHFEPQADARALLLYERAADLDPANPMIQVEAAEVLIDLEEPEAALARLQPMSSKLDGVMPEFWGSLAIARLVVGDEVEARAALTVGEELDPIDCRVSVARELLRVASGKTRFRSRGTAALNLVLRCDQGLFDMFLRRLPDEERHLYS